MNNSNEQTLKEKIEQILEYQYLTEIRNHQIPSNDEYYDALVFLKHTLFLLYTNRIVNSEKIQSENIREMVWQYLTPNSPLKRRDENEEEKKKRLVKLTKREEFVNTLTKVLRDNFEKFTKGTTEEFFLHYWKKLDNPDRPKFSIELATKLFNEKKVDDDRKMIIFNQSPEDEFYNYDTYISTLNSNLYEKSEYYDLIMLDSISVSQYSNRGGIRNFENLLINYRDKELKNKFRNHKIFQIGKTHNGLLNAMPISRNFHLPSHSTQFKKSSISNISATITRFFSDEQKYSRQLNTLTHEELVEDERDKQKLNELLNDDYKNSIKFLKEYYEKHIQDDYFHKFSKEIVDKNIDIPFNLKMKTMYFIPMQLAKGNHAAYTLMAYTANANIKQENKKYNSLIYLEDNKSTTETNNRPTTINERLRVCEQKYLEKRLKQIFRLIFLFVPNISLCLDHITSAKLRERQEYPMYWFDPCLPIEAITFHSKNFDIQVLSKPSIINGKSLSCLGGFNLGITTQSRTPSDAANIAIEIVKKTLELRKNKSLYQRIDNIYSLFNLCESDLAIPEMIGETIDTKEYIETPSDAAFRPNIDLWPLLETKISATFRIYVAALFIFRAIHFDCVNLQQQNSATSVFHGDLYDSFFIDINNRQFDRLRKIGFEMHYIDKLMPYQIEKYLKNIRNNLIQNFPNDNNEIEIEKIENYIKSNINDILDDSDYICGVLKNCTQHVSNIINNKNDNNIYKHQINPDRNETLNLLDNIEVFTLYRRANLFIDCLAKYASKTIHKEIKIDNNRE